MGEPRGGELGSARRSWLTRPRQPPPACVVLTWLAVAVGVVLRVSEYATSFSPYMDEQLLMENLVGRPAFDLRTPLINDQIAPPGFLVVERLMVRLPADRLRSARAIPLGCGIGSMLLIVAVGRTFVERRAVPVAAWLFALADYLVEYSTEVKPYSCDVALTLGALLLAAVSRSWAPTRRYAVLGALGAAAVWFSFPIALVLAGVGTWLILAAAVRKRWAEAAEAACVCLAWASSFVACYAVSRAILGKRPFIWDWWGFAFLPLPPRSMADVARSFWQVANIFLNPSGVVTPLSPPLSAIFAMGLFLAGAAALGHRWRGGIFLLVAPVLLAVATSALHKYPFHGRLLLFLIPSVHLLVAEGTVAIGRLGGRLSTVALVAFLLYQPVADAVWRYGVIGRERPFVMNGDLGYDLLHYLRVRGMMPR
jgi:hypothetical protein